MSPSTAGGPPSISNPRGKAVVEAAGWTLGFVVITVVLRLWGRLRYAGSSLAESQRPQFGEPRFWVLLSDLTILLSFVMVIALTIVACYGVAWGFGLHAVQLTVLQNETALEMFFIYQIFYKFASGISKIATCFLLLAISSQQMTRFNMFCKILIIFIAGYCVSCSIATVFQCGLDFKSNWIHTLDQSHCFPKPPFWYIHAGMNIFASIIIAALPWWLFYYISYKRKYVIATLMTMLAVAEVVLGCVRLEGLYLSSHSLSDLSYGATTGILVSQLEVNFGIISACVPTILKITEEYLDRFWHFILRKERPSKSQPRTLESDVQLSALDKTPRENYRRFGDDEENDIGSTHSDNSRDNIIDTKNQIMVQTSYVVQSSVVEKQDERRPVAQKQGFSSNVSSTFK